MGFANLYALGTQVSLISDIFRVLSFFLDGIIYSLIPAVYGLIYSLYDFSVMFGDKTILTELVKNVTSTVYSFLAIYMFFRVAFSLITMLVDPATIDDKEKGAKKIVTNIMICLLLIVVVPKIFEYARVIQTKVMSEQLIEKVVFGDEFGENDKYSLGNELSLSVWGMFLSPVQPNAATLSAYNSLFNNQDALGFGAVWPVTKVLAVLNSVTGIPIVADVFGRLPIFNNVANVFDAGTYYQLSYVYILSTIVGAYVLWTFIKLMIDIAYRSIKFFALELISPIAIISYIDPVSSKKGLFSKWMNETVKTYISLFIRVFVFAFTAVLLRAFSLSELQADKNIFVNIFYILAVIAFIKNAPKFIDNLFGTTISKDSDTKFASDMFRGVMGGATVGVAGAISGAVVAKKTGQSVFKGALSGGWNGFGKGYSSGKKGDMIGVVKGGIDTYSGQAKKYGYNVDKAYERDLANMERYVKKGKDAKTAAIMQADANDRYDIKALFNKRGRTVNGFEVTYSNLIGDAEAEGLYKKYMATVAENGIIPEMSEDGLKAYNTVAQRSMYAALSKMQSAKAESAFNTKYSAFLQKDSAGQEAVVLEAFNNENARRASLGETTYSSWQDMYKDIGGLEATANITLDDAYKFALENEIKIKTGHTTDEWANIAGKDAADLEGAKDNVKRHEASSQGLADKRKKKLYAEAKGKTEAQSYKP